MSDESNVKNKDIESKQDPTIADLIAKASKENKQLSKEEVEKLLKESNESIEFLEKLKSINMGDDSYRIIFTDGNEQLLYDNGEFFLIDTTNSNGQRKKISKKDARDIYMEYFIRYILNPIIKKQEEIRAMNNKENRTMNKEEDRAHINTVKEHTRNKNREAKTR